jgi:hypothetical protein
MWAARNHRLNSAGGRSLAHRSSSPAADVGSRSPATPAPLARPALQPDDSAALSGGDERRGRWGGTDLLAGIRQGIYRPRRVIDLSGVPELGEVGVGSDRLRLGAGVKLARLLELGEIATRLPALREAVAHIATPQVRNMATVGGNLCQQKRCWFFRGGFLCYKAGGWTCPCYAVLGDSRLPWWADHAAVSLRPRERVRARRDRVDLGAARRHQFWSTPLPAGGRISPTDRRGVEVP